MVDLQFVGLVAVVMAVATGGSVLAVLVMTAVVALVTGAYEAGTRRYRRRDLRPVQPFPSLDSRSGPPPDDELTRWMTVIDRVLRSTD